MTNSMDLKKLADFINNETNVKPKKIRDVKIFDNFSFINVPFREAEIILEVFKRKKQKGKSIVQKAKADDHKN